jgi:uncharacterized protein (UPF0261 family)
VHRPCVALLGTLDTKGSEYQWLTDQLEAAGARPIVLDAGAFEPRGFSGTVQIDRSTVASAAGADIARLVEEGDRGRTVTVMGAGAAAVLAGLLAAGQLDGVLAVGGSGGSSIAARAMRDLPLGLPKLLVSTMASGDVSPYVGANDITLMYSVVDIAGINQISRVVLGNAVAAITAMAVACRDRAKATPETDRPLIAASMFGVTTPAVDVARARL